MDVSLAIVIPAYKGSFFREALNSLANQTNKNFRVYVGDDSSPDDIGAVCKIFDNDIDIVYKRFSENVGRESLIKQWNRCVSLSCEPWVCLFSDDDVMAPECVELFYQAIEANADENIFRFNTQVIDAEGELLRNTVAHPEREYSKDFVLARLTGNRDSFVSEYIFKREIYNKYDGFVDFPAAWCADDATWVCFSEGKGISVIDGAKVGWRLSDDNITAVKSSFAHQKIVASLEYLDWLDTNIFNERGIALNERNVFLKEGKNWFLRHLWRMSPWLSIAEAIYVKRKMSELFNENIFSVLKILLKNNIRHVSRKLKS